MGRRTGFAAGIFLLCALTTTTAAWGAVAFPRPRPPASRPATQEATPQVAQPIEAPSPPVVVEAYGPFGHAGRGAGLRAGNSSPDFLPIPDRWRVGFPGDYVQNARGSLLDPYNQNVLKGDYPILGQDKFLVLTATSDTLFEARKLPVPSGVSTSDPNSFDFFGGGDQRLVNQNIILSMSLFEGDAGYRPRDWEIRFTPVMNFNYVHTNELGLTFPDVRHGDDRDDTWIGMQEAFLEVKLADLSSNFDFASIRAGIQPFVSDFRGFLYSDNQLGVRLFGNADNNKWQYNLAVFSQLEKDTNSGLNAYDLRDQTVIIANLYRQDFLFLGYTAQVSFHANLDDSDFELDTNGFLVRPAPVGTIQSKDVRAYYFGWAGDGHLGRLNLSHQFYWALGQESFNPLAGSEIDINAQFFAVELSYDHDWRRYRASFAYASGDDDPTDETGRGFDGIFDNPNFAGGGFNFFTRQAIRLTGSGVNLVNRNSFYPDLRTSKEQGQANFVNPGLFLYNIGADFEVTPRVKVVTNVSYLMFAETDSLKMILHDDKIARDIGIDYSMGVQYRPFLNNNAIITGGAAALTPAKGFRDIYSGETLYSVFLSFTFTY